MKKTISILLCLILAIVCFAACTPAPATPTDPPAANPTDPPKPETPTEAPAPEQPTEAPAPEERKLLIYCPQSRREYGEFVANMAKEQLGIEIEWLKADGGTCRDKVLEEKNNPQADLVLGLAQIMIEPLITADCLIPYTPSWASELEPVYIGTDGYYTMYWQTPILIVYNPEFIKDDMIPTSWEDLADPKYNGMFRMGKLTSQTSNVWIAGLLSKYSDDKGNVSDEGWKIMKGIFDNSLETASGDYNDFVSGKTPIMLDWFPNPDTMAKTFGFEYEVVLPKDGNPLVAEGVAIVKGTKHENVAKEFIEWYGQPLVQAAICNFQDTIPAQPSVAKLVNADLAAKAVLFDASSIQKIDWKLAGNAYQDWMTEIALW